jgi:hypothetical protein
MRGQYQNEILARHAPRVGEISDDDLAQIERNQDRIYEQLKTIRSGQPSIILTSLMFGMMAAVWWKAKDL